MRVFAADMDELIDTVLRVFESDDYTQRMETTAIEAGFTLRSTPAGITPIPLKDGRPLSEQDYTALPDAERQSINERAGQLQHTISRTLADIRRLGKAAQEEAREVDKEIVASR